MAQTQSIRWKGREATLLSNGMIELIALTQGGHLAEFRFSASSGIHSQNVLWEAPWMHGGPQDDRPEIRMQTAGLTGHGVCLDYFGAPSPAAAAAGLFIHGEAAAARWEILEAGENLCRWRAQLPVAGLTLVRKVRLGEGESVVYVQEDVLNRQSADHVCHWVQHVTFGPPFLAFSESTLAVSAKRGITSPTDYQGCSLLAHNQEFAWPNAPKEPAMGRATADLRAPFAVKGLGFLAGLQLDPQRKIECLLAVNWKMRLGVGYLFRQQDFPWMAVWEENCARPNAPWNSATQARGMEFGTTPLPVGGDERSRGVRLFDEPCSCVIPANGKRMARYAIFLFEVPDGISSINSAAASEDAIVLYGASDRSEFFLPARGCEGFLAAGAL